MTLPGRTLPAAGRRSLPAVGRCSLLAAGLLLFLAACSSDGPGTPVNHPPHVRLTGGPIHGDSASYQAVFYWTGWDDDGVIDHYRYARMALPPGVPDFDPDDLPPEAWHDTVSTRASFLFTSPEVELNAGLQPTENSVGRHFLAIQAVDDGGLESEIDWAVFTSRNLTPTTTITFPRMPESGAVPQVGHGLTIQWEGIDRDSSDPLKQPVAYEWKLFPLPSTVLGLNVDVHYAVTVTPGPDFEWHRVDPSDRSLFLNLQTGVEYVFAVRAIDEAGGVEPFFTKRRNAIVFAASGLSNGRPTFTVREPTLGEFSYPSDGSVWEVEAPLGACLRFELLGDASSYGGVIDAYNWCIDPADGGADNECRGWTRTGLTDAICFETTGLHTILFRTRDSGAGVTSGTIVVRVVRIVADRKVLYVDDFRQYRWGELDEGEMDARMLAMLEAGGVNPRDIRQWDTFGPADSYADPVLPRLSEMAPYRFILWNVQGAGLRGNPGLTQALACRGPRILRSYLNAGGQLWICGQQVFSSLTTQGTTTRCLSWGDYSEAIGLIIRPTDFICDWMGICSGDIRTVKERYKIDGLLRALPTAEAAGELFPVMAIDSSFAHPSQAGLFGVDAVFQPNFDASGGLDTLYTADPVRANSPFRRKPVAFRYHDPDPAATSGSIALFGIPLHLLQPGSAEAGTGVHGMAKSMLDWFRRHERVTG